LVVEVPHGEFFFSRSYSLLLESAKPLLAMIFRLMGRRVPFTKRGFYPFHLTLFGKGSLEMAMSKAGFEVVSSECSTERLEYMMRENRRHRAWPRWTVNRLKLAMARRGMGDTLFLVARREASR
jgi:hypothetical protein